MTDSSPSTAVPSTSVPSTAVPSTVVLEPSIPSPASERGRLTRQLALIGGSGGVLSGLLGVGGGVIMVPLLVLRAGYRQRDAHAISLGAIIPISIAGIAIYGVAGEVRYGTAIALAAGSIVGARIGAGWLARIDERLLKVVFGTFLVAVAVLMGTRG